MGGPPGEMQSRSMYRDVLLPFLCIPYASRAVWLPGPDGSGTLPLTLETLSQLLLITLCQIVFIFILFNLAEHRQTYTGVHWVLVCTLNFRVSIYE